MLEPGPHLAECTHAHGSTHVVGEDVEGGAVWQQTTLVQGKTVYNSTHTVLTHTKPAQHTTPLNNRFTTKRQLQLQVANRFHIGKLLQQLTGHFLQPLATIRMYCCTAGIQSTITLHYLLSPNPPHVALLVAVLLEVTEHLHECQV